MPEVQYDCTFRDAITSTIDEYLVNRNFVVCRSWFNRLADLDVPIVELSRFRYIDRRSILFWYSRFVSL